MSKTNKVWRVRSDYDGRVTAEKECNHVILSNKLPQEQLAQFAKNPAIAYYLEKVPQTVQADVE